MVVIYFYEHYFTLFYFLQPNSTNHLHRIRNTISNSNQRTRQTSRIELESRTSQISAEIELAVLLQIVQQHVVEEGLTHNIRREDKCISPNRHDEHARRFLFRRGCSLRLEFVFQRHQTVTVDEAAEESDGQRHPEVDDHRRDDVCDEWWCAEDEARCQKWIEGLPVAVVDPSHQGVVEDTDGRATVDEHEHDVLVEIPLSEDGVDGDGVNDEDDEVDEGVGEGKDDEVGRGNQTCCPDIGSESDRLGDGGFEQRLEFRLLTFGKFPVLKEQLDKISLFHQFLQPIDEQGANFLDVQNQSRSLIADVDGEEME